MSATTYKEAVYNVIKRRNWVSSDTIKAVGGADGLRRLGELREAGFEIKTRRTANGTNEYRLVAKPQFTNLAL